MISRERAYALRQMIVKASASLADDDALEAIELFAVWQIGVKYSVDERVRFNEKLYRVEQAHTSRPIGRRTPLLLCGRRWRLPVLSPCGNAPKAHMTHTASVPRCATRTRTALCTPASATTTSIPRTSIRLGGKRRSDL